MVGIAPLERPDDLPQRQRAPAADKARTSDDKLTPSLDLESAGSEITIQPNWLKRLFGAKPKNVDSLTLLTPKVRAEEWLR